MKKIEVTTIDSLGIQNSGIDITSTMNKIKKYILQHRAFFDSVVFKQTSVQTSSSANKIQASEINRIMTLIQGLIISKKSLIRNIKLNIVLNLSTGNLDLNTQQTSKLKYYVTNDKVCCKNQLFFNPEESSQVELIKYTYYQQDNLLHFKNLQAFYYELQKLVQASSDTAQYSIIENDNKTILINKGEYVND